MNYDRIPAGQPGSHMSSVDWRLLLWDRLIWLYGSDRAESIMFGKDEATNRDLLRWRNFGRPA